MREIGWVSLMWVGGEGQMKKNELNELGSEGGGGGSVDRTVYKKKRPILRRG